MQIHEGRTQRFGPEEADADDILLGASWSTQIPGGFHDGSITIPRDLELSAMETKRYLLAPVEIYGPDGTAYKGRVASVPSVGVDVVELQLEGDVAMLEDDKSFRELYVDRDLSRWSDPSIQRRLNLELANAKLGNGSWATGGQNAGASAPGITQQFSRLAATVAISERIESWYYAGGIELGEIYYDIDAVVGISGGGAAWTRQVIFSTDDIATAYAAGTDHTDTDNLGNTFTPTPAGYKYALLLQDFIGAFTGDGSWETLWSNIRIWGLHGLTKRGTSPSDGLFASDIVQDVVSRCAPGLPIDHIETSTFVIQQAAWIELTTAREIIEEMTALGGGQSLVNDWGVYDDGFFWRAPGTYGKTWRVRQDETHEPQDEGPTAVGRCNGVVVRFQDPAGTQFTVGPVGSGADYESSELEDTDPDNPYNRAGVRAWTMVDAGLAMGPSSDPSEHAVIIGRLALLEANADHRRGSVLIKHEARDDAYNTFPAHRIRAGDRIVVEDDLEDTTERRVISTSYDMDSDTCTASIGTAPDRLDALLARLAIVNQVGGF